MSRAVIDQSGFRIVFFGLLISLLLGLTLKAQISSQKVQTLLQEATVRLENDFIIDFQSAEVILSKWGLPLPYLQISQIRLSPKKATCQDSQIYIDKLIFPLSPMAILTSQTLVQEISASTVELRLGDLDHCVSLKGRPLRPKGKIAKIVSLPVSSNHIMSAQPEEIENIFQIKTAGLLKKAKIDQLKIISKKYAAQPLNLRSVQVDFSYENKKLEQVQLVSQVYALKDPQSDLMFFKGELTVQMKSKASDQIETEAKLHGRLLDGEIQAYTIYNSLEQNIKLDFALENVALKPLVQLNVIEAAWLNYPVSIHLHGYGQYQIDGSKMVLAKLNDILVSGEKTHIRIQQVNLKKEKDTLEVDPFTADIQQLDLNKLATLHQIKNVSQSVENFGQITGVLKYKTKNSIHLQGVLADPQFIFSSRGQREILDVDSFHINGQLTDDIIHLKLDQFKINHLEIEGNAEITMDKKATEVHAEAQLEGNVLPEKIWELLTGVLQQTRLKLHWNYKKGLEERQQMNLAVESVKFPGLLLDHTEINIIQSGQNGISTSLALSSKVNSFKLNTADLKFNGLEPLFNSPQLVNEKNYSSDGFNLNLKGTDWKSMSYDFETKLKGPPAGVKLNLSFKGRGEWAEDGSSVGAVSVQNEGELNRFEIRKKENSNFEVIAK